MIVGLAANNGINAVKGLYLWATPTNLIRSDEEIDNYGNLHNSLQI